MKVNNLRQHRRALFTLLGLCIGLAVAGARLGPKPIHSPSPDSSAYLRWLENQSMLYQASQVTLGVSGHAAQRRHPYGRPQPREAVRHAAVWLLDYPGSVITRPGRSVLGTWADARLWDTLRDVGIDLLHTGPVNRA